MYSNATAASAADAIEFAQKLNEFAKVTRDCNGSYNYTLGFLESFATSMFMSLSKEERILFLEKIQESIDAHRKLAGI